MSFNPAPTQLFAGMSEDGTNLTIPIASIPELTAAEADATTGDLRKLIYALGEQMHQWYNNLAAVDRPAKVTIGKSIQSNTVAGTQTVTYSLRCVTAVSGTEVVDE